MYDTDTTMDAIRSYTKVLNATQACAAAAVRTVQAGPSPGDNAGALACTANIPGSSAGNLC